MTVKDFGGVNVSLDHGAREGRMLVPEDADPVDIREALKFVDEQGYEDLDPDETGDDLSFDEQGRAMVPLVRIGGE